MRSAAKLLVAALIVVPVVAQTQTPAGGIQQAPPAGGAPQQPGGGQGANRGPRPYDQVITAAAKSEKGVLAVHKVADRYFFEIHIDMLGRDFLLVSRLSGAPAGGGGFQTAGSSVNERMVRWERRDNTIFLKSISIDSYADESEPIAKSVAQNNFAPILAAFPIAAFGERQHTCVIDVTDFFAGDTPALSGLSTATRRTYGVHRFDPAAELHQRHPLVSRPTSKSGTCRRSTATEAARRSHRRIGQSRDAAVASCSCRRSR